MAMKKKQTYGANIFKQDDSVVKGMESSMSIKILIEKQKLKDEEKKSLMSNRVEDQRKMKEMGFEVHKNVLFPQYVNDERLKVKREVMPKPPSSCYYEIGYD